MSTRQLNKVFIFWGRRDAMYRVRNHELTSTFAARLRGAATHKHEYLFWHEFPCIIRELIFSFLVFNSSSASTDIQRFTTIHRGPNSFFTLFANALAFFRKHQRLPNGIQECFSSFFRSEAVFDLLFISVGVPCCSEKIKKEEKDIKTISALMKNKKTQAFLKKDEKSSN